MQTAKRSVSKGRGEVGQCSTEHLLRDIAALSDGANDCGEAACSAGVTAAGSGGGRGNEGTVALSASSDDGGSGNERERLSGPVGEKGRGEDNTLESQRRIGGV
jgi:hypothetical protein